jgi:hypothetical protein
LKNIDVDFLWRQIFKHIFDSLVNLLEQGQSLFPLDGKIEPEEEWVQKEVKVHAIILLDLDKRVGLLLVVAPAYGDERDYFQILTELLQIIVGQFEHGYLRGAASAIQDRAVLSKQRHLGHEPLNQLLEALHRVICEHLRSDT